MHRKFPHGKRNPAIDERHWADPCKLLVLRPHRLFYASILRLHALFVHGSTTFSGGFLSTGVCPHRVCLVHYSSVRSGNQHISSYTPDPSSTLHHTLDKGYGPVQKRAVYSKGLVPGLRASSCQLLCAGTYSKKLPGIHQDNKIYAYRGSKPRETNPNKSRLLSEPSRVLSVLLASIQPGVESHKTFPRQRTTVTPY